LGRALQIAPLGGRTEDLAQHASPAIQPPPPGLADVQERRHAQGQAAGRGQTAGPERTRGPVLALGPASGAARAALRHVMPFEEIEASERRAARRGLPHPKPLVGQVALALLEVEAGRRSPVQLERRCEPEVWERICGQLDVDPARRAVPPMQALVRVHCQEPLPGLVNGVAVVRRDGRVTSISMRLEARADRWVVTDLRMLVPLDGYLSPWPPPGPEDAQDAEP
jgi:hypothetical protein